MAMTQTGSWTLAHRCALTRGASRWSSMPAPAPPDVPPPVPRWWVVRSPDGQYMDARPLTHDEWADLHHADFGLHCHGDGTAGEIRARAALATLVAQIGAEQRTARAEQHAVAAAATGEDARACAGSPGPGAAAAAAAVSGSLTPPPGPARWALLLLLLLPPSVAP